jgi:undecaprenyl-diphosphatase
MLTGLVTLLAAYGYALIFILILLESAGLPLPGETLLVIAAAFASSGHLSIFGVVLSAALGAILGDMGGYWIGRRGGATLLKRILGRNYEGHISKGRAFFNRYGAGAVFLARFVPGVRVVGANLAGVTQMPFSTFMLFNAAGGLTWAITMGSLGYVFGNNLPYLESILRRLGAGMFIAICIIAVAIYVSRQMSRHEDEIRAWLDWLKQSLGLQRFQTWFISKYQSNRVLALSLGGGLLLAIFSGWIFGALAEDILSRDSMTLYDAGVSRWLLSLATEDSSQFFFLVTLLGSAWFIFTASLLISSWLVWRKQWLQLGALIFSVVGGALLNVVLKNIFLRPRPDFPNNFYYESGYSFPSGHAMLSVLFYGMTAYLIASQGFSWKTQIRLGVTAFTFSLLIGFSRIFLGVHYLTDVLGGWSAGVVWLIVCIATLKFAQLPRIKVLKKTQNDYQSSA